MSDALKVEADLSAANARIARISRLWRELGQALTDHHPYPLSESATGDPVQEVARWGHLWRDSSPEKNGALVLTFHESSWTVWRFHPRQVEAVEEALGRVIEEMPC